VLSWLSHLDPITLWAEETQRSLEDPAFQRDPEFLERLLPLMEWLNAYFDSEVRGFENVPEKGPMLLVGNHSGGFLTPDTTAFISAWYRERGIDDPLIGLAFDAAFGMPGMESLMRKIGEVPANAANAERALDSGVAVLVYPGGAHEALRPWTDRSVIDFDEHKGFIKLALRKRVPVVPVVGHGGHHSTIILTRGEAIAKVLGLDRIRMNAFPILLQVPWGLTLFGMPAIPLPAKITVQICEPLDWSRFSARQADDPEVLRDCYDEITGIMQQTLDELAEETPYPVLSRLRSLIPFA
jgi:1-acyl-sn-glycerol-3-phosphate acyltransferase